MRVTFPVGAYQERDDEAAEAAELEELRRLLERTSHEAVGNLARCGDVATTGLRRLDDGQNETAVELYYMRKKEASLAQQISGLPAWDSSPLKEGDAPKPRHVPRRDLEKEYSFEERVYNPLMKARREKAAAGEEFADPVRVKPRHAEMIESMMRAYRHEQGGPKTMRSPRTGRLREIEGLASGRIALGRTVPRRGSRSSSRSGHRRPALSPQQLAKEARDEAAKAEAAVAKAELLRRAAPPWAIGGAANP